MNKFEHFIFVRNYLLVFIGFFPVILAPFIPLYVAVIYFLLLALCLIRKPILLEKINENINEYISEHEYTKDFPKEKDWGLMDKYDEKEDANQLYNELTQFLMLGLFWCLIGLFVV